MPNWKTYESSVRLLSAIVAAHPELKLNYDGKQAFTYHVPTASSTLKLFAAAAAFHFPFVKFPILVSLAT
jgi:hypothetical protein